MFESLDRFAILVALPPAAPAPGIRIPTVPPIRGGLATRLDPGDARRLRRRRILTSLGLFVQMLMIADPAAAQPPVESSGWEALKRLAIQPLVQAESLRDQISRQVTSTADRIDTFFGDQRMASDYNGSYLQIDGFGVFSEHNKPVYDLVLRGKIDLPRTENRLKLVLETDDSGDSDAGPDGNPAASPLEAAEQTDYSLALRFLAETTRSLKLQFDAGIRLDSSSRLFVRGRYRKTASFEHWARRFSQSITWRTDDGWISSTRLDFDRPLSEPLFFRSSSTALWNESVDNFELGQNLILFQSLDADRKLSYRIGMEGESEPVIRSTNYVVDLRYRKRIHKTWLFYEILPALNYPREDDFRSELSIQFTLSVIFGND